MTPPIPQSIEEIVKAEYAEVHSLIKKDVLTPYQLYLWVKPLLTSAIQGERNRIIKLLPPEKPEHMTAHTRDIIMKSTTQLMEIENKGYNDYRREALEILTPKEI